jgi:BON domain
MSAGQREFGTEPPDPAEIWAALEDDDGIDTRRVLVAVRDEAVVLGGAVASPEEADRASSVVSSFGVPVVNRLQIDPALREGGDEPRPVEQVEPVDSDEVLVGDPDMLAGPDARITDDVARSLDENEPLEPPEDALFPPTPAETLQARTPGPEEPTIDEDEAAEDELPAAELRPAAADLTEEDLREAAAGRPLPALDPELDATQDDPTIRDEPPSDR